LLASGDSAFPGIWSSDEWTPIALNYTSGTTGDPKGVVPSHRGTYLMSLTQMTDWVLPRAPTYLWTLPMFHANGWCFTWAITAAAGTHVCLRIVNATNIFRAIAEQVVTHFCAAPIVMAGIANTPVAERQALPRQVRVLTAGSSPPAAVLEAVGAMGFELDHVFGITEISGTSVSCAWQDEWASLPASEQALLKARQGVRAALLEGLKVADPETLRPVRNDGTDAGEMLIRGNTVVGVTPRRPRHDKLDGPLWKVPGLCRYRQKESSQDRTECEFASDMVGPYRSEPTADGRGRQLVIDPDQARVVRRIFENYAEGSSARGIAHRLNAEGVPSPRGGTWAVSAFVGDRERGAGLLYSEIYIGRLIWNRRQWLKDPETGKRRYVDRPKGRLRSTTGAPIAWFRQGEFFIVMLRLPGKDGARRPGRRWISM